MRLKQVKLEDFVNYKEPSLFLGTCFCDWKCCTEAKIDTSICQNSELANAKTIDVGDERIYELFSENPITKCVVIGGLEPMIQMNEIVALIKLFREKGCDCRFIIYTGYVPNELVKEVGILSSLGAITVKFGRYNPLLSPVFDNTLGVELASDNQFSVQLDKQALDK